MKKLAVFIIIAVTAMPAFAVVPRQISFQGMLIQNGQPVSGTHILKLNLYNAATGGTLLYSDLESATVDNGVFSVFIGSQIPIPDSLTFDRTYYLGISIDNGPELSPRTLLTPTAAALYSVRSGTADSSRSAATAAPTGTATGDLAGSYPAPEVVGLASHPVSTAMPTAGQTLIWDGSQWAPSSGSAVAFSVIGLTFQTLPHDVFTTIDFTYNNTSGAFDAGNYFSLDSDWFTAPTDGYYYFDAFISLDTRSNPPSEFYIAFFVDGVETTYRRYYSVSSGGYTQLDYTLPLSLKAGDHVRVECNPNGNNVTTMGGNSYGVIQFSGFKIN